MRTVRATELHLVLKYEWYDMIESGEKPEEYRECNPYWRRRFVRCFSSDDLACTCDCRTICACCVLQDERKFSEQIRSFDYVIFHRGYTSTTMKWEVKELVLGRGKPEWGAPDYPVFIIRLGKRIRYNCIGFLHSHVNKRARNAGVEAGYANGYVAVPADHPLCKKSLTALEEIIDVHGGITFTAHSDDIKNNWNNPEDLELLDGEIPCGYMVYGFDTLHAYDNLKTCSRDYCVAEVNKFRRQFELWES